jgi:hypothetical protein
MPAIVVPNTVPQYGAGYLYKAPLGTAIPTNTVAGSVFTDVWAAAWIPVGITREGSEFTYKIDTDTVTAAEYLDPLKIVSTGREASVAFEMMQIHLGNYKTAFNAGTGTTTAVSGTGATTLTKISPPVVGSEVRIMLGWESEDFTERWIYYQCLQTGEIKVGRHKGSANAGIPVEFSLEQPSATAPFDIFTAGAARVGT